MKKEMMGDFEGKNESIFDKKKERQGFQTNFAIIMGMMVLWNKRTTN